jgi:PadR family transcriptional regulator, regulatory protein AphA
MSRPLDETSYIVLGLLELTEPATPYDLERIARLSTIRFWTIPHSKLYAECARLAEAGLLTEEREQTGRRRRIYRLTDLGREALDAWRADPAAVRDEVHSLGLLKLFLGAEPHALAAVYLPEHEETLRKFEALREVSLELDPPRGGLLALEAGIGFQREAVRFWKALVNEPAD